MKNNVAILKVQRSPDAIATLGELWIHVVNLKERLDSLELTEASYLVDIASRSIIFEIQKECSKARTEGGKMNTYGRKRFQSKY